MSFARHHEDDLITVWGLEDARIGDIDWLSYLEKEQARLARKGIVSDIVSMSALRNKRGKCAKKTIYALKRRVEAAREDPPRPACSQRVGTAALAARGARNKTEARQ